MQCRIWNIINKFHTLLHQPICTLNGSFMSTWLCNIMHWSFGNIDSWCYVDHSNVDTFYYTISKISFINTMTNLVWKVFKYWGIVKLMVADTSFLKIIFCLKTRILSLAINAFSFLFFVFEKRNYLFSRIYISTKCLNLYHYNFSASLSFKWKLKKTFLVQLTYSVTLA